SALAARRPAPKAALTALNRALASALARLRVRDDAGRGAWTWDETASPLDRAWWPAARSAAELAVSGERARIRECAAEPCGWLFVDRSRNGLRRWCDMTVCGNRDKVRRYQARKRAGHRTGRSNRARAS